MALGETALGKRVKSLELQGLQKIKILPASLSALEVLLNDVYVTGHPRPSDYHHRRDLVRVYNVMAKEIYGSRNDFPIVEAFGSFLMDIFSAESDLDLSVNFSNDAVEFPRDKKIQALRKFSKVLYTLQRTGHVHSVQPIMRARVPILKVVDRGTGIECDISIENKDGIAKSHIVHMISGIDERFQKLSFLMKAWAKAHDINSSKDRTLNSLSIILLVAFHLQTRDPPILPPFSALFKDGNDPPTVMKEVHNFIHYGKRNKETLAELFVTQLAKLASVETLWSEGLCASTYEGCWISKKWGSKVGHISVEDFTDRSQNVARSVGMEEVQEIYKCIHRSLHLLLVFMDGQIQAPKLKELLFGADSIPRLDNNTIVNLDRSFPFHDPAGLPPPNLNQRKKMRFTEGWGAHQSYGETSSNVPPMFTPPIPHQKPPFVAPGFGNVGSHGPLLPPFIPPECGYSLQQNPKGFERSHGPLHHPIPPRNGNGLQQNPIGLERSHGKTSNNVPPMNTPPIPHQQPPFVAPEFGNVGSHGPLHPPFIPPEYGYSLQQNPKGFERSHGPLHHPIPPRNGNGLQQNPVGLERSHGPNLMFSMPYGVEGHSMRVQPSHYQNPEHGPPFYPYGHG